MCTAEILPSEHALPPFRFLQTKRPAVAALQDAALPVRAAGPEGTARPYLLAAMPVFVSAPCVGLLEAPLEESTSYLSRKQAAVSHLK